MTPIFRFPEGSPYASIVIKREDLSETGSHKCRYLKSQLEELKRQGIHRVVLSTTGNVGITASHYGKQLGINVLCLMSEKGDMDKAAQIEKGGGFLVASMRPKRFAEYFSKKYSVPLLRASREEDSLQAYASLGEEIKNQVPEAKAIVNFATSGTSSLGLALVYGADVPALHIVHEANHEIVRNEELSPLVKKSGGDFWSISDAEFLEAEKILRSYDLETSWEGISSFAAGLKIKDRYDSTVVIFSGKKWPERHFSPKRKANTLEETDFFWKEFIASDRQIA